VLPAGAACPKPNSQARISGLAPDVPVFKILKSLAAWSLAAPLKALEVYIQAPHRAYFERPGPAGSREVAPGWIPSRADPPFPVWGPS